MQGASAVENAAVALPEKIVVLREQLSGYILSRATEKQLRWESSSTHAPPSEASVVKRAMVNKHMDTRRWHIQRGLLRLGFGETQSLGKLRIHLEKHQECGRTLDMPFKKEDFKSSFQWGKDFANGVLESLEATF